MTNEEATDELFDLIVSGESSRRNVALRIAIEALKAESCEDCISREWLYNECLKIQCDKKERYFDIDDVRKLIVKAPPVTPARKKGKWVRHKTELGAYWCDQCGKRSSNGGNYCPNCGSKMGVNNNDERASD